MKKKKRTKRWVHAGAAFRVLSETRFPSPRGWPVSHREAWKDLRPPSWSPGHPPAPRHGAESSTPCSPNQRPHCCVICLHRLATQREWNAIYSALCKLESTVSAGRSMIFFWTVIACLGLPRWCLCVCVKSLQLCLTLCNPMDHSPPGSSVHGISQSRTLEWVVMPFSRGSFRPRDQTHVSCIGRWVLYH